ncbi:Gcd10p-domain-containing protein [Mytilinidion resinicola]|uniref:tRNA (adenine(58)-N(1))-methyltransferase non-catalytic subunit TRM6 n=1 Tax=Mytilinidion resinicola TaxID=574789 RepID=A0A6A6YRM6_9PEZI|nr:Gcd10p-domain-containing protein [Mytilinidion resinicola]KAF2811208.1 Gcd10p-domain-containing protein [Mytilinidion resinicola]
MHSYIRPNTYIVLRLPSGILKLLEILPNTNISIGKFGTFQANSLLGRPYYLTFEILDKEGDSNSELRVVPAAELHESSLTTAEDDTPAESTDEPADGGAEFDIVGDNGEIIMQSNRLTIDDPSRQTLTMEEIEELKKAGTGSGKEVIARIMKSHQAIDEKTPFSLAKYTLRKSRKYLRRFTVFPADVNMLSEYVLDKEAHRIMELREENLGLINSWANIHCAESSSIVPSSCGKGMIGGGRWLVVDDTGGLLVASLAERMGLLYPEESEDEASGKEEEAIESKPTEESKSNGIPEEDAMVIDTPAEGTSETTKQEPPEAPKEANTTTSESNPSKPRTPRAAHIPPMSAQTNTLTIVHSNAQPNLGYLKYFSYDATASNPKHPLHTHLKTLTWLQMLYPEDDPGYQEPETLSDDLLSTMKSSKRGTYFRKRRRWERVKRVVQETRAGGFDGLVVASVMEPATVLRACVPLLKGGATVTVYSANVEPLVELCDYYSKERRTAFVSRQNIDTTEQSQDANDSTKALGPDEAIDPDFPVNPTLLLAPSLQTARARQYQVLPGRTHPLMTSRGGAEGFLFTATRVLPVAGRVEARGTFRAGKKRKIQVEPEKGG